MELSVAGEQIAIDRVIEWRSKGVAGRLLQALVVGILAWVPSHSPLILWWYGVLGIVGLADAAIFSALRTRVGNRNLRWTALASLGIAAGTFAAIGPLLLTYRSPVSLAGALLILCAANLNNALMARGWKVATYFAVGGSSLVMLLGTAVALYSLGYPVALLDGLALLGGAIFFIAFIGVTASILDREGRELNLALSNLDQESQLARMAQAAAEVSEAANQAKTNFLANISHEIRTPLNGILGMAQVIASDDLTARQRERVGVIHSSGKSLLAILNDVLDIAKIEAGKLELETAVFDIDELIIDTCSVFSSLAVEKGLVLRVEGHERRLGSFEGDPLRIRQIISNLISNAIKFTQCGEVCISVGKTEHGLRVSVRDTGVGISPEGLSRLFTRFEQEDKSTTRLHGGTGLGLAIAGDLTAAMGGTLKVESTVGVGSTFSLEIPLRQVGDATPEAATQGAVIDQAPRVLAADDNPTNRLVLRAILQQSGIDPMIVDDGAAAVAAWRTGSWDVILMDIQMPVLDGLVATRQIREEEATTGRTRTPIIALTANTLADQVESYFAGGMDGLVPKPVEVGRLFAEIEAVLAGEPHETRSPAPNPT